MSEQCKACEIAQDAPLSGLYYVQCPGCKARAIAQSPEAYEARQLGSVTKAMKRMLQASFGDDWRNHIQHVQEWARKVNL